MKVYLQRTNLPSLSLKRVADALIRYAPDDKGIFWVDDMYLADLVIVHAIGFPETEKMCKWLLELDKKYVVIQYCLKSTQKPAVKDWMEIWRNAVAVWSYYDLQEMSHDEGVDTTGVSFLCTPLGGDSSVFFPHPLGRKQFKILTSGYVAESETVKEAADATKRVGASMFHLGPQLDGLGRHVMCSLGMDDVRLRHIYSDCEFVAGLRRCEGFELPAVEGLLCGARPIVYDRPHYRRWFNDFAVFIPEGSPEEVTDSLVDVFKSQSIAPVTEEEITRARDWFNWERIAKKFWSAVL